MRVHPTHKSPLTYQAPQSPGRRARVRFLILLGVVVLANVVVVLVWREPLRKVLATVEGGQFLAPTPYRPPDPSASPGLAIDEYALAPSSTRAGASVAASAPSSSSPSTAGAVGATGPTGATAPAFTPLVPTGRAVAAGSQVVGRVRRNQTLAQAFAQVGANADQTHAVVAALQGVFDFRRVRAGSRFTVNLLSTGDVRSFEIEISPEEVYVVERGADGQLRGHQRQVASDARVAVVHGVMETSLYDAVAAAGEQPALAALVADAFAWEIDFYTDPRKGDRFRMVVEKVFVDGKFQRYRRLLAARYDEADGKVHTAVWYKDPGGQDGYYTADGGSLKRPFLRTPMRFVHITSKFGKRFHPVLGHYKAHNGVDYGAPAGTPVWSVADGTVSHAGWAGANGKLVRIRHTSGYETMYAHLSRISKDVRVGRRVRQQQVIGHVGSTGLSTGPHLHFAMKRNDKFVNPASQSFPRGEAVATKHQAHFRATTATLAQQLQAPWEGAPAAPEGAGAGAAVASPGR